MFSWVWANFVTTITHHELLVNLESSLSNECGDAYTKYPGGIEGLPTPASAEALSDATKMFYASLIILVTFTISTLLHVYTFCKFGCANSCVCDKY